MSKQKIDIKRHLDKNKKCIIISNTEKTEDQLYHDSLEKHIIEPDVTSIDTTHIKQNKYYCQTCFKVFSNKSNLNKHIKNDICTVEEKVIHQVNHIQNIGVQNNTIQINIHSLRGFDEDWNIENITKDMKEKLLLSDKKFTNTLENILKYDENLNVIIKDKMTGLVYKIKNNEYEAMPVSVIFEEAMDKIYKHLRSFFTEIISNNINDIRVDILNNEINEVDRKYIRYKNSVITSENVNKCFSTIFDDKKKDAIQNFINILNEKEEISDDLY